MRLGSRGSVHWRTARRLLLVVGFTGSAVMSWVAVASAVNIWTGVAPRYSVSYCVASAPPEVGITRARTLLDSALNAYELASGQNTAQALSFTQNNPCTSGTNVRVTYAATSDPNNIAEAGATEIRFNPAFTFWDGIGTRASQEYYYAGIMASEIGHTVGMLHAGGPKWSYDGNLPSMVDCQSEADSVVTASLAQDDWGMAAWVRAGGVNNIWSANPGFETDFSYWGHSSGTASASTYARTGSRGVRLAASGDYVYITSVYDPYNGDGTVTAGMSTTPDLGVSVDYKTTTGTGGVTPQYQYQYIRWSATGCKHTADGSATVTSWSALTNMTAFGTSTSWRSVAPTVRINNSTTNRSTAFRARVKSSSTAAVYIDRVGGFGGTAY